MKCWYAVFLKTLICTVILFRISKNLLYWKWILKNTINTTPSSNTKCAKSLKILQYCSLACPLDHSKYYWEKLLIEMYLIFASRMAPSPFLNIWACECCSTINFQCCRTLSFLCLVIHPTYMPEKCQGLLGVTRKRAVAVSIQLADCEDPQPALWVRNALWLRWSADHAHFKRYWRLILLFKDYTKSYCHCLTMTLN